MKTPERQMDSALRDFEMRDMPKRINGQRQNTYGEKELLDAHASDIVAQTNHIKNLNDKLEQSKREVNIIKVDIEEKTKEHSEIITNLKLVINKLKEKLDNLRQEENRIMRMFPNPVETIKNSTGSKKKDGSSIWILILVTLGLDIITFISTYSLQLEVLNVTEVLSRFLYVLSIFGISILLHVLHKRNGKKFVQIMLVSTIALSLLTMFHVIYVSLNTSSSTIQMNDFTFSVEEPLKITESILDRLISQPGLIEMMLAAIFCIAGVVYDIITIKTNNNNIITQEIPQERPLYHQTRLTGIRGDIETIETEIRNKRDLINKTKRDLNSYFQYHRNKLKEIKETIKENKKEKERKENLLKTTLNDIFSAMRRNRELRCQMLSRLNNVALSEVIYEEWSQEDIKNYYNL